jgi:hypothetical protein
MSTDASTFLLGGGGKSAKFENVGDAIKGVICAQPELRQQTDIKTGAPKCWDNGDPMMQLVVKLQTEQRDPADPEDDGIRALYISGGFKRASLQKAVAEAVRAAKAKNLDVGGTLAVRFTGEEPSSTKGFSPAKLYAAQYQPPAAKAAEDFLGGGAPQKDAWEDAPF